MYLDHIFYIKNKEDKTWINWCIYLLNGLYELLKVN